jgi:hypothetical protein
MEIHETQAGHEQIYCAMNLLLYEDYSRDQPKVNTGLITKAEDDDDDE